MSAEPSSNSSILHRRFGPDWESQGRAAETHSPEPGTSLNVARSDSGQPIRDFAALADARELLAGKAAEAGFRCVARRGSSFGMAAAAGALKPEPLEQFVAGFFATTGFFTVMGGFGFGGGGGA